MERPDKSKYYFDYSGDQISAQSAAMKRAQSMVAQVASLAKQLTEESASKIAEITDYVVETGTQSGWKYKKWKSGLVECWASSLEVSMGNYSTWTTDLLYSTGSITYPFTFANSDNMDVFVNCTTKDGTTEVNGIILIAIKSTTGCQIRFVRKTAASKMYINAYIRGTLATS